MAKETERDEALLLAIGGVMDHNDAQVAALLGSFMQIPPEGQPCEFCGVKVQPGEESYSYQRGSVLRVWRKEHRQQMKETLDAEDRTKSL